MNYLTGELYKKAQLFHFPMEGNMTLEELAEELELDLDEFLLQELLAHEEWYHKYLPEPLHSRLFDGRGEISFQETDDTLLQEIAAFRAETEKEWMKAVTKVQQTKQQLWKTAEPGLRTLLNMNLAESEIRKVFGMNTDTVTMKLYPAWDMSKIVTLKFTQVKDSWMSRMHVDDANWWLVDEITADAEREGRYVLQVLFGNADFVGQIQFTFAAVEVLEQDDSPGF